jgi:hypothetical protein
MRARLALRAPHAHARHVLVGQLLDALMAELPGASPALVRACALKPVCSSPSQVGTGHTITLPPCR